MRSAVLLVGLMAGMVLAGTPVDQGKPGTQGAWPVAVTSGGWTPDGGYLGSVTVIQGVGVDGGQAWNVSGSVGATVGNWELVETFDVVAWTVTDGGLASTARLALGYPPDGGAFTWEYAAASAPTTLYIRPDNIVGRGLMVTTYVAGGSGTLVVNVRIYGYDPPTDVTLGSTQITSLQILSAQNGGGVATFGTSGYQASNPYAWPIRTPAIAITFTSGTTFTSASTAGVVQVWRLP